MNNDNKKITNIQDGIFHCCYLLKSIKSKTQNLNYIGYTNNPIKRLSQHNGLILGGAKKTTKHRPWEMLFFVKGFINEVMGLQFEWAWQHPHKTKYLKGQPFDPDINRVHKRLRECISLINSPPFSSYNLTLVFLNHAFYEQYKSLTNSKNNHISAEYLTEEEGRNLNFNLKNKYLYNNNNNQTNKIICSICKAENSPFETTKSVILKCNKCSLNYHTLCIYYIINKQNESLIPKKFICANKECRYEKEWYNFIKNQYELTYIERIESKDVNISSSL